MYRAPDMDSLLWCRHSGLQCTFTFKANGNLWLNKHVMVRLYVVESLGNHNNSHQVTHVDLCAYSLRFVLNEFQGCCYDCLFNLSLCFHFNLGPFGLCQASSTKYLRPGLWATLKEPFVCFFCCHIASVGINSCLLRSLEETAGVQHQTSFLPSFIDCSCLQWCQC